MADLARIKRNVAKMASQNAPETDIDGYIASEGVTLDDVRSFKTPTIAAPQATQPEFSGGRAGAAALGAADTFSVGFGDELGAGLGATSEYLASLITGEKPRSYDELLATMRDQDKRAKETNPGSYLAGQVGGGIAQAATLGPLSLGSRGSTLGRVAAGSAADGAVLGGLYGAGSGETADERISGAKSGIVTGGLVGGAVPLAVAGAGNALRRVVSPAGVSAERQAAANVLAREGVETSAGQQTGNRALRYMESELGGGAAENMIDRQSEQFTAAALRRAGINANRATPEVIDSAFNQLGSQFDHLGARNTLIPDQQMLGDIQTAVREYKDLAANPAPAIDNFVSAISSTLRRNPNGIPGRTYQSMRSQIERYARKATDPDTASALRGIKEALDDTMERGLAASGSPDLGEWRAVRGAYRNLLTLQHAAGSAGENAAAGLISPAQLRAAVVAKQGRGNYARGRGDFDELARAGEMLMRQMPNSGTAGRLKAQNLSSGLLAGGGALAGGLPGMAAGLLAPRLAGAAIMSRPGQAYLSNNMMSGPMSLGALGPLSRMAIGAGVPQVTGR